MYTSSLQEEIWQYVAAIPHGKVATYGQIATLAGFPNHARYVGTTLRQLPSGSKLPWFRVINGKGMLSFPRQSPAYQRQQQKLEAEGVRLCNGRISLSRYQWQP